MSLPQFTCIVACDSRNGIGKNNTIPWHLPSDLKFFAKTTKGNGHNTVIMGRKTWESLPQQYRPLPLRTNIVISSNQELNVPPEVAIFPSLDEALQSLENTSTGGEIFVIGGAMLYTTALSHPSCSKVIITIISKDFECDVFFPPLPRHFVIESISEPITENDTVMIFTTYSKHVDTH
ncbi:dihydrofolate reductase [Candidatus Falkowbacteria bacterium]|nr:dihydrofolate reductase [Candidatus Falkowbacteria bacterium]